MLGVVALPVQRISPVLLQVVEDNSDCDEDSAANEGRHDEVQPEHVFDRLVATNVDEATSC